MRKRRETWWLLGLVLLVALGMPLAARWSQHRCLVCGGPLAPILWGFPGDFDGYLFDRVRRGELVLGGCVVPPLPPHWQCRTCGRRYW